MSRAIRRSLQEITLLELAGLNAPQRPTLGARSRATRTEPAGLPAALKREPL